MENPLYMTSVLTTIYLLLTTNEMHAFSLQIPLLKSNLSSHDFLCFLIFLYHIHYDDCINLNKVSTVIPRGKSVPGPTWILKFTGVQVSYVKRIEQCKQLTLCIRDSPSSQLVESEDVTPGIRKAHRLCIEQHEWTLAAQTCVVQVSESFYSLCKVS